MNLRMFLRLNIFFMSCLTTLRPLQAATPYQDYLQQAPQLKRPEAGYQVGALSQFSPNAQDISKGFLSLALDLKFDEQRGPLMAAVSPTYSPGRGISPFGFGFSQDLSIHRFRLQGSVQYNEDDQWQSPWGPLLRGTDGYYYPQGLVQKVRIEFKADQIVAYLDNRQIYYFGLRNEVSAGTYGYFLTKIIDHTGQLNLIDYEKTPGGTWLITKVRYGGRDAQSLPYSIDFINEDLNPLPVSTDYLTRELRTLDRRISEVRFSAFNRFRYAYVLGYENGDFGPGFFLVSVQKRFASGDADPAQTLKYRKADSDFGKIEKYSGLDDVIDQHGRAFYQGENVAFYDWNQDGLVDLEVAADRQVYIQTAQGFQVAVQYLDKGNACFPRSGTKKLARKVLPIFGYKRGLNSVGIERGTAFNSKLTVCDLDGNVLGDLVLPLSLEPDSFLRWVDLNQDGRVDLVRLAGNSLRIFANQSADGQLAFTEIDSFTLPPNVRPQSIWFDDLNGDGLTDFLLQSGSVISVYHGITDFDFSKDAKKYLVYRTNGTPFTLNDYSLDLIDFNGDGLSDLSLTKGKDRLLFANNGREFIQTKLPIRTGLANESESFPLQVGDDATPVLVRLDGGGSAMKMNVGSRYTQFLTSWNDGRGTLLDFEYKTLSGIPGQQSPRTYLSAVIKSSVGMGVHRTDFRVNHPVLHNLTPMLLGYESVIAWDKLFRNELKFMHRDEFAGIVVESVKEDLKIPGFKSVLTQSYSTEAFKGLSWPRLDEVLKAQKRDSGIMEERQKLADYDTNMCAKRQEFIYQRETLVKDIQFWKASSNDLFMSCLPSSVLIQGQHARLDLNFAHRLEISRLPNSDPDRIEMLNPLQPEERMFVQGISYDSFNRPEVLESSEGLKKTLSYEADSNLPKSVTTGFGLKEEVTDRDAYDFIRTYVVRQNSKNPWIYSYKRDGRERLSGIWDRSFGSADQPLLSINYKDPSLTAVGALEYSQYHPMTKGYREWADVFSASGAKLGQFEKYGSAFVMKNGARISEADRLTEVFPIQVAPSNTYESLDLRTPESRTEGSALFEQFQTQVVVDHDSTRKQYYDYLINDFIEKTETTNGKYSKSWKINSRSEVVAYKDEENFSTTYDYDALGRLRGISLPDGKRHTIVLDVFGRTKRIQRTEVGAVEYDYNSRSLISDKRYFDTKGNLDRTVHQEYDEHGRKVLDLFVKGTDVDKISYYYDGNTFDGQVIPGQLGKLTQVQGLTYLKTWIYDDKGRLAKDDQVITTRKGRVTRSLNFSYDESDRLISKTLQLQDNQTNINYEVKTVFDATGRQQKTVLNGREILNFGYNALGLTQAINSPESTLVMEFDSFTQNPNGFRFQNFGFGQAPLAYQMELDDRGFASLETYDQNGIASIRSYMYSPRGFLEKASINGTDYRYAYDANGLINSIQDRNGTRTFRHEPSLLQDMNGQSLVTDAMSRIVKRGAMSFTYGSRGVILSTQSAQESQEFIHDEAGNVLVTRGKADEIHFGTSLYKDGNYLEPLMNGQQLIGWLENGQFKPAVSDFRGTPLLESNVSLSLDPFGAGPLQGDRSSSLHFAGHGLDEASGLVRMGVRQYDSNAGLFLSPDPLFLEKPEECIESPVECSLFSYSGNNPVTYVDPTGFKYFMGHWVFENKQKIEAAVKQVNDLLVDAGYADDKFDVLVTGGDRYVKDGKAYSSTDHSQVGETTSQHVSKKAFDFEVKGIDRETVAKILEKNPNFKVAFHYKDDNHIHVTVINLDKTTSNNAKKQNRLPEHPAKKVSSDQMPRVDKLEFISIKKRCMQNNGC
jgi:RHS repeat-associated protein